MVVGSFAWLVRCAHSHVGADARQISEVSTFPRPFLIVATGAANASSPVEDVIVRKESGALLDRSVGPSEVRERTARFPQ